VTSTSAPAVADPGAVWRIIQGFSAYWATVAALDLGLFDALAGGPQALEELAEATGGSPSHLEGLVDALVAVGLLGRAGDRCSLLPVAETFLVSGARRSMAELVRWSPGPWSNWPHLADTVRTGRPPDPVEDAPGEFYGHLVDATFPTQHAAACRAVEVLGIGGAPTVLDLGAGAAPWAIAVLETCPEARAVVNDLPDVVPAAIRAAERHGVADRCRALPGDYFEVALDDAVHDVVVLANVCRAEGAEGAAALIARAARALRPGGRLLLADYFLDDDRTGPPAALMLGLTMMAATTRGRVFCRHDFSSWVEASGLTGVEFLVPLPGTEILTAVRPTEGAPR